MAKTRCHAHLDGLHKFTPATCICGRCLGEEFDESPPPPSAIQPVAFSKVKIVADQGSGRGTEVTVDGVEQYLTRVDLKLEVGAITTIVLHHVGPAIDFEGLAKVVHVPPTLEERVRRALERVRAGDAAMRIPADPNDPDLVLADVLTMLELAREKSKVP